MSRLVAAVPFVRMPSSQNPNMKIGDTDEQQNAYWRSMYVTLASFRRWNPDLPLQIITNAELPAWVTLQMAPLGVEVRLVPFAHRAPEGFSKTFAGSVYLLDALAAQKPDEDLLLVDPDVICIDSVDRIHNACSDTLGVLPIDTPSDDDNNGLSLRDAAPIHAALGGKAGIPTHMGGEIMVIPGSRSQDLRPLVDQAWQDSLDRFAAGQPHMRTEEHVLTYAFGELDTISLAPWAARIWTAAKTRTVSGDEGSLILWHLPAEKERGFKALYPVACDFSSWFWSAPREEFILKVGQAAGLWNRRGIRLAKDIAGALSAGRVALPGGGWRSARRHPSGQETENVDNPERGDREPLDG